MKKIKKSWKNLRILYGDCKKCKLWKSRAKIIFGKGPRDANILLIGEAPGGEENIKGVPFIGKMGKLLDRFFAENGFDTKEFYITNTCICRPPNNRMPRAKEVKACFDRLKMEIELVSPEWIIYVGARAATVSQLGEEYYKFFEQFNTHFMNHPGSIRYDKTKKEKILEQIGNFKNKYNGNEEIDF